jgi:hypothetical protein
MMRKLKGDESCPEDDVFPAQEHREEEVRTWKKKGKGRMFEEEEREE